MLFNHAHTGRAVERTASGGCPLRPLMSSAPTSLAGRIGGAVIGRLDRHNGGVASNVVQRAGGSRRRCRPLRHPSRLAQWLVVEDRIGIGCLLLGLRIPSVDHLWLLPVLGWERRWSTEIGWASYSGCHNTCELGG